MFRGSPHHCGQTGPVFPQQSRTDVGPLAPTSTRKPPQFASCRHIVISTPPPSGALSPGVGFVLRLDVSPEPHPGELEGPTVKASAVPGRRSLVAMGELPGQQSTFVHVPVLWKLVAGLEMWRD